MPLREYRRKRDFAATPEPAAGGRRGRGIFVVQLHHASHRHYDFRLELDGVLKSWAVPKGPSFDPAVKRLAMEVEDHPLSYADFEGDIPAGNYGAGHVDIFDRGTWEPLGSAHDGLRKGDLKFALHGDVLRGEWVLVRTKRRGGGKAKPQWLLIKHRDGYAGPREADDFVDAQRDRPWSAARRRRAWKAEADAPAAPARPRGKARAPKSLPGAQAATIRNEAFAPELCRSQAAPPGGDAWLHEVKWDGYRILASVVGGEVRLWSRNAIEWTHKLPELAAAVRALKLRSAQLDGEMIVLREGRDDFNALQSRLSAPTREPALYVLFDLVHLNGVDLREVALIERKALLQDLLARHPHPLLRYSEHQIGNGAAAFASATAGGLEGVVSKRVDSAYSGRRSGAWVKAKARASDEFAVIGYTEPKGSRSGIGALLLGKPVAKGWRYVGRVGTGIGDADLRALGQRLARDRIQSEPAEASLLPRRDRALALWVRPRLVVEVFHQGIGGQGLLRQPAFKALRADKTPRDLRADASEAEKGEAMSKPATKSRSAAKKKEEKKETKGRKSTKAARPAPAAPPRASRARAVEAAARPASTPQAEADGVVVSHPEREVFPGSGLTKADVAAYYRAVAPWLLSEVAGRPLSVVRCPDGIGAACFFQKHLRPGWGEHVRGVAIAEKGGRERYLCIDDARGLLELVQMNVLELHPWGARAEAPDLADRVVFDLDPHAGVAWSRVVAAARDVRRQLAAIGLETFLKTSGGKGLHVVLPLSPAEPWEAVKRFAEGVAKAMAALRPDEYVAVAGEKKREGRIFIDWLRNGRGATSVAAYSLRARAGAGVAMPLAWADLGKLKSADAYTLRNAVAFLRRRRKDPWAGIERVRQSLPPL